MNPWYWRSLPEGRTGAVVFAALFHRNSKGAVATLLKALPDAHRSAQLARYSICAGAPHSEWMSANVDTTVRTGSTLSQQLLQRAGEMGNWGPLGDKVNRWENGPLCPAIYWRLVGWLG